MCSCSLNIDLRNVVILITKAYQTLSSCSKTFDTKKDMNQRITRYLHKVSRASFTFSTQLDLMQRMEPPAGSCRAATPVGSESRSFLVQWLQRSHLPPECPDARWYPSG